ncbi:MAG: VOC family protein [Halieaceae bacterium]|jgi:catechol 2,3-dioxygenase-like lactoylglutathione lyase family enzyme|nr:VOC family protein [Halieaceae bacterium]
MAQLILQSTLSLMINGFAAIVLAVPDLDTAVTEYDTLLGGLQSLPDCANIALANVRLELVPDVSLQSARIKRLVLWSEDAATALPSDCRGLELELSEQRELGKMATDTGIRAVDHVVLRSRDADDCIRLFSRDLGMRLALDQAVPEWGGRMLFFRSGKLTLEVIQHLEEPVEVDHFWGITYLCEDLAATLAALDRAGVDHSGARDGRKPGTLVATVKSNHLGIPTLLIQPASR